MVYVLIDTCSWLNLLNDNGDDSLLQHLLFWKKEGHVTLLAPEKVKEEWNRNKPAHQKSVSKSIQTKYTHANEVLKREGLYVPQFQPPVHVVESLISKIDEMLDSGIYVTTPDHVKAMSADRAILRKAPFHNDKTSLPDAYIIFSALDYLVNNGKNHLIFVSDNKNDFGDSLSKVPNIHPDIAAAYPSVTVDYYAEFGHFIHALKVRLPSLPENVSATSNSQFSQEAAVPDVQAPTTKEDTLEQMHQYLESAFEALKFIPPHILIGQPPFKVNNGYYPVYHQFTLTLDNEKVFDVFDSLAFDEDREVTFKADQEIKIDNALDKARTVLRKLNTNLIFHIEAKGVSKRLDIRYKREAPCPCVKCRFFRFRFTDVVRELDTGTQALDGLLKHAYVHYQMGKTIEAATVLMKAADMAYSSNASVTHFIVHYNLSKLKVFIKNSYDTDASKVVLKSIGKGNLDLVYASRPDKSEPLRWLKENSFYANAVNSILRLGTKIKDQYYDQPGSSYNSNADVWELINEYAELEAFLEKNCIVYDRFTEFKNVFDAFLEAAIASHGITKPFNDHLDQVNDWMIQQMLYYADADRMLEYKRRYGLRKLKHHGEGQGEDSILNLISNLLNDPLARKKSNETHDKNFYLSSRLNSWIANALVILSKTEFDPSRFHATVDDLLNFLENEETLYVANTKYVKLFLSSKAHVLDEKSLDRFFRLFLDKGKYHDERFAHALSNAFQKNNWLLSMSEDEYAKLEAIAWGKCPDCNHGHSSNILVFLFPALNTDCQLRVSKTVGESLRNDYDADLYYMAALFEILDFDDEFFDRLLIASTPQKGVPTFRNAMTGAHDDKHQALGLFINLCFKLGVDLSAEKYSHLKGFSPYYDWLLDMKNFNYDFFDPKWIAEYDTVYYHNQIRKHPAIKQKVEAYLKDNSDITVEKNYLDIYTGRK